MDCKLKQIAKRLRYPPRHLSPPLQPPPRAAEMSGSPAPDGSRSITILHLNDVYDICPRDTEPVGGAARMVGGARPAVHVCSYRRLQPVAHHPFCSIWPI